MIRDEASLRSSGMAHCSRACRRLPCKPAVVRWDNDVSAEDCGFDCSSQLVSVAASTAPGKNRGSGLSRIKTRGSAAAGRVPAVPVSHHAPYWSPHELALNFSARGTSRLTTPSTWSGGWAAMKAGSGIINMTNRIDAIGGRLKVESSPGRGVRIHGAVPAAWSSAGKPFGAPSPKS